MLFQVLSGFKPIFYTTHPNEEPKIYGKPISFTITTNGSLLTEEMVEEFLKYNTKLTISLDGPKQIQDKNRVYLDGSGTYDIVSVVDSLN